MKLNPELKEVFREFNILPDAGMLCLFSIYHQIPLIGELAVLLEPVMMQINVAKIVDKDYRTGSITWNITLYEGEENEWSWIDKEYRPMFKALDKLKAGSMSSCSRKMKEFFKAHPSVRKQDVLAATKLYLSTITDTQYMQQADYFIFKNSDKKSSFSSRLEQYLEVLKDKPKDLSNPNYKLM